MVRFWPTLAQVTGVDLQNPPLGALIKAWRQRRHLSQLDLAVDRYWNVLQTNTGAAILLDGVAAHLLAVPNALRIALHPDGLAPRIRNLAQWRHHVIGRLRREATLSGSAQSAALLVEIESYPGGQDETIDSGDVAVPLELTGVDGRRLTFLSTVTTFGTALDLTAAELSIEAFLPADDSTAAALR